jgi:hypothetical protein
MVNSKDISAEKIYIFTFRQKFRYFVEVISKTWVFSDMKNVLGYCRKNEILISSSSTHVKMHLISHYTSRTSALTSGRSQTLSKTMLYCENSTEDKKE